jgi:hypothetical protein
MPGGADLAGAVRQDGVAGADPAFIAQESIGQESIGLAATARESTGPAATARESTDPAETVRASIALAVTDPVLTVPVETARV